MNERDIFLEAVKLDDPAAREAYLEQACGGDAEFKAQLMNLLESHERTSQFLESPAVAHRSPDEETSFHESANNNTEQSSGETEFRRYLEPSSRPDWLGRLGHYEIEQILGRGAFGIVAKAFDEKLHRVVAIKLMSPDLATTSPPRKRFLREARTAAAVTHENVVAIYAVEEEPIPYLVMEYIPGKTLQQRMDELGPLEVEDLLGIGQQVAAGLAAAHSVNLIHRDIKPSNILLTEGPSEKAKLSDFGMARAVDDATLTSSGLIAGTPLYMAPEQARGETLDHRADLFSLGGVLYQMVSGRPPFRAPTTVAVLKRVCDDTPRSIRDIIPGTPTWLESIIFKLLEKDRENRYQSAQEVADLLAQCQSELVHDGKVTCVEVPPETATTVMYKQPNLEYRAGTNKDEKSSASNSTRRTVFNFVLYFALIAGACYVMSLMMSSGKSLSEATPATPNEPKLEPIRPSLARENETNLGIADYALQFDGDAYVQLPFNYDGSHPLSIECRVRCSDFHAGRLIRGTNGHRMQVIMSNIRPHPNFRGIHLEAKLGDESSCYYGWTSHDGEDGNHIAAIPKDQQQFVHLAYVLADGVVTTFVDGRMTPLRRTVEPELLATEVDWLLGAHLNHDRTIVRMFVGALDELRISNIARYSGDYIPVDRLGPDQHTIALYHFDEGEGDILRDSSGNGHHGKIHGATWETRDETSTRSSVETILQRSLTRAADAEALQYNIKTVARRKKTLRRREIETRTLSAQLLVDGNKRFLIKHPGPIGLSHIWLGSNGAQFWVVPPRGPAVVGQQNMLEEWLAGQDEIVAPFHNVTSILRASAHFWGARVK